MTVGRYIALITALYVSAFCGAFAYLGEGPVFPLLPSIALVVGAAAVMAALGTFRAMQFRTYDAPRFLLPSVIHGTVIAVMVVCVLTVCI